MVDRLELGDLVQPRAEPGIAAERADLLGDDDQRVLGDVLDRLRVEHELADGAANDPQVVDCGEKEFEGNRRPLGGGTSDLIEQRSATAVGLDRRKHLVSRPSVAIQRRSERRRSHRGLVIAGRTSGRVDHRHVVCRT